MDGSEQQRVMMRIGSSFRNAGSRLSPSSLSVAEMNKSEIVADLFNHQPPEEDNKESVRVHLSNASRALTAETMRNVEEFLAQHQEIAQEVEKIELSDDRKESLTTRKLKAYLKWLEIREQGEMDPSSLQEAPYLAIHAQGKDQEIRNLYQESESKRQLIQENRRKHLPSYYYMVYPETYSFN